MVQSFFSSFPLILAVIIFAAILSSFGFIYWLSATFFSRKGKDVKVGFFHPYTNDGGGGEKVLWCAVIAIQEEIPHAKCYIYTGDKASSDSLSERALNRFGLRLLRPVEVVELGARSVVDAALYPRLTLLCQSVGSIWLAWEAVSKLRPGLFVDTSGYAFSYVVPYLYGCRVACYTHYPTVSADMLERVKQRKVMYNNEKGIAASPLLSSLKLLYYQVLAAAYGFFGRFSSVVLVNSSWTRRHIDRIWKVPKRTFLVYPPCNTMALQAIPIDLGRRQHPYVVSVAQFRPEKMHSLQLRAFQKALERLRSAGPAASSLRLKLVGSSRHKGDEARIEMLASLAVDLGIEGRVDFCINASYSELQSLLGGASAGLHTMTDEHFGISVVEYMAAGAIPIAHNSGGPREDIVVSEGPVACGFLAASEDEFADFIVRVATMADGEWLQTAAAARKQASKFSELEFSIRFKQAMGPVLKQFA